MNPRRIRPPSEDDPIYLIQEGPAFHSTAMLSLVQLVIVFAVIAILAAALRIG